MVYQKRKPSKWIETGMNAANVAYKAHKAFKGYVKTKKQRSQGYNDPGITAQYDRTLQYKKRKMPKYKRKRWIKFIKKVQAATDGSGTQQLVFNNQISGNIASGNPNA